MIRFLMFSFCVVIAFSSCKKKRSATPPEAVSLVFPEENSECTTGVSLGTETSQVEFRWNLADNTETYELRVTNIATRFPVKNGIFIMQGLELHLPPFRQLLRARLPLQVFLRTSIMR